MVAVVSNCGIPMMPTTEYRARRLLKKGRAVIFQYRPFTIKILDRETGETQPVEYKCDTGYQHIGISVCSEKREYINEQRDMLPDEVERHTKCRKYRRDRRNRKRYRKARFNNRKGKICEDGFAPSIRNRRDIHIRLFQMYQKVLPITSAVFEMGQFDTQVLKAVEEGNPLPQGTDYQHGEQYGYATLREAAFNRDNYTCIVCKKSGFKDNVILRIHHLGYRTGDRTNRMSNLATVCTGCHTSKNHQKGGLLYDLKPKLKTFKGATFMTMVRWDLYRKLKNTMGDIDFHITYGAMTKLQRKECNMKKSHSNDAYCMGKFHPKYRCDFKMYQKVRRNHRVLQTFTDAKYIDIRTGKKENGSTLSCNRTNRKESRMSEKNLRIYRGEKITKGKISVRRNRYPVQANDIVVFQGKKYTCHGCMSCGKSLLLLTKKESPTGKAVTTSPNKIKVLKKHVGWKLIKCR